MPCHVKERPSSRNERQLFGTVQLIELFLDSSCFVNAVTKQNLALILNDTELNFVIRFSLFLCLSDYLKPKYYIEKLCSHLQSPQFISPLPSSYYSLLLYYYPLP